MTPLCIHHQWVMTHLCIHHQKPRFPIVFITVEVLLDTGESFYRFLRARNYWKKRQFFSKLTVGHFNYLRTLLYVWKKITWPRKFHRLLSNKFTWETIMNMNNFTNIPINLKLFPGCIDIVQGEVVWWKNWKQKSLYTLSLKMFWNDVTLGFSQFTLYVPNGSVSLSRGGSIQSCMTSSQFLLNIPVQRHGIIYIYFTCWEGATRTGNLNCYVLTIFVQTSRRK